MKKQEVYDNYGFKTTAISLAVQSYLNDPQKEKQRISVWKRILANGFPNQTEQQQQLIRMQVRNGIPDQLRPQVWMKLIIPPLKQYESVVVKEELKQIDRDIGRTIPTNKREQELKEKLRHMLNVLAVAFPEMGYCQGLNFIVANLLILLDVKQCYNVMYHILFWQHHQKLMENLDKIHIKLYTLHRLIRKHYPRLCEHLKKWEIDPMLFASSWFITLFSNTLSCPFVFRILEIYFVEGEKILYRVALQILKQKKKILKKLSTPEDVIGELKSYEQFNKASIDRFFKEMFEINLSRKQIQEYESEYESKK